MDLKQNSLSADILAERPTMVTYIFPADPLSGRTLRVDEHFEAEYAAASRVDSVGLIDLYSLGDLIPTLRAPAMANSPAVYRGWMLSADDYAKLIQSLVARGYSMLNSLPGYLSAHSMENWLERFSGLTPSTAIFDPSIMDASAAVLAGESISPEENYFLKGLSKSEPDASRAEGPNELLERLAELGESFGEDAKIAVRNFVPLDSTTAELRSWWLRGELFGLGLHPNFLSSELRDPLKPMALRGYAKEFLRELQLRIAELDSNFLTADIALTAAGEWTLIELGDGQVSGLRQDGDAEYLDQFYGELTERLGRI